MQIKPVLFLSLITTFHGLLFQAMSPFSSFHLLHPLLFRQHAFSVPGVPKEQHKSVRIQADQLKVAHGLPDSIKTHKFPSV